MELTKKELHIDCGHINICKFKEEITSEFFKTDEKTWENSWKKCAHWAVEHRAYCNNGATAFAVKFWKSLYKLRNIKLGRLFYGQ